MKNSSPIRCVIYDLDGVLLDTEPIYTEVTQEIVGRWGKTFDWSVKRSMIGRPSLESARHLVAALDLPITPEEYLELRSTKLEEKFATTPAMPGAERFTRAIAALGVRQAIATSSERRHFDIKATQYGEWFSLFATVVTGDDRRVARGKPAPDIFLVAAETLGAAPGDCLVFEDSPAGVDAAHAAEMRVIALPDPQMDRARYGRADLIADGFDSLDMNTLPFSPAAD
jgi:pseudouridine-5'-monophosphatase